MNVSHILRTRLPLLAVVAVLASCNDNPSQPIPGAGDPENISRVTVSLTPTAGGSAITSVRVDPDGTTLPQDVQPAVGTLALTKGTTYNGTITLLNDIDPQHVIDITAEVSSEANFHRFFYTFTCDGISVPVSSLDLDTQSSPQPVGLHYQVVVSASAPTTSSCNMHVELHHFETDKGDGTGTTFDTDLSLDFPVTIN